MDATLPPEPEAPADARPVRVSTQEFGPDEPGHAGAEPEDEIDDLAVGAKVGRYIVVERLGAGAMGVVHAAYDPKLDRKVALKLLRARRGGGDQARRTARLEREAQAVAKLSHPNVVGIFDVVLYEERVVLAMEYLGGGTLHAWLDAKKRTWREIVTMFIEVGKGLAAAHAAGQIHRDFKPDNVLLDVNGVPKVADFGLVRLARADSTSAVHDVVDDDSPPVEEAPSRSGEAHLTRTGALAGTPAYMAPEQFMGKDVDARSDQFAFCVALYESLYGERPFAGETVVKLAESVTAGQIRPAPKSSDVPAWVRACVLHGLRTKPAERYPDFVELLAVLSNDPIARRRRRLGAAAAAAVLIGGVLTTRHFVVQRHQEIERQAAEQIAVGDVALTEAAAKRAEARTLRDRAFAAFDGFQRDKGEEIWAESLSAAKAADVAYQRGIQRLEAAVTLTPRRDLKDRIAEALVDYIKTDGRSESEREVSVRRLVPFDEGGVRARRLNAPATLKIETEPSGLVARIEAFDPHTHAVAGPATPVGKTPLALTLERGSYRLSFDGSATHVGFHYPVVVAAGEMHQVSLHPPRRSSVPSGFVYIPKGRFLFGSDNEEVRSVFLGTVPVHQVDTAAFLISKYETTLAEWIAFLDTLTLEQRQLRRPHGRKDAQAGAIEVDKSRDDRWRILFRATDRTYRAAEGELLRYEERNRRTSQNWLKFPVTGLSPEDALAYVSWLDRSGRVPRARLCSELEWERAARGADAREFPHGDGLASDDANFDQTYGRKSGAFGPDEVGSHGKSESPFGVQDLSGNVWEIAMSVLDRGQFVVRGGSFYQAARTLVTSNRDPISAVTRDHTVGLRVCSDGPL